MNNSMNPFILLIILIIAYFAICFLFTNCNIPTKRIENIASVKYSNHGDPDNSMVYYYDPRSYQVGFMSGNGLLPWWNSTRHTRNMSYDPRGGINVPINYVGPWNISPFL